MYRLKNIITVYCNKFIRNRFASRLLKNAVVSFAGEGGAAVITFITTIILIRLIGSTKYGILMVANSFIIIVDTLVNFQSWHAMVAFGAQAEEKKDSEFMESLIKIGTVIDFGTAILGTVIALVTARFFSTVMLWNDEITQCIYMLSFMILFNFTGTSVGIIRLFDKFKYYSIFRIVTEILRFTFVIIFCGVMKKGLYGAALSYALGYVLGYIFLFIMFLHVIRLRDDISVTGIMEADVKKYWKRIFSFTCWTSLTSSADIPVQQMDVIFLSMISYEVVAVFKVYKQIGQALSKLTTPLKQAVMPIFSELIAKGKIRESYEYMMKMTKKMLVILIPSVLVVTGVSVVFMHFTLSREYVDYWYILLIYMLLRACALAYAPMHPLFIAMSAVKQNFFLALSANIVYIALVWSTITRLGIWAVILGIFAEYFITITFKKRAIERIVADHSEPS